MGRHPFVRENLLWMSIAITIIGLLLVVLSYTADYQAAGWTDTYESYVPESANGSWNMLVRVVSPVILITGVWYLGEQILARRKFERLINAEKKSDFRTNLPQLEETVRDLPAKYEDRLQEKQGEFKSRR